MSDLHNLNEFIVKNSNAERTIKCTPEGISFTRFAAICDLPGVPEEVEQSLQPSVTVLRNASPDAGIETIESGINGILSALIANADRFVTMDQYGWLARTTVAAKLLHGLPCKESGLVKNLYSSLEVIQLASYNYSPVVIHLITKYLLEDIPLEGVNLLHVIKQLGDTGILYYVAVSLIFAGLDTITGSSRTVYRIHTVDEFLHYLDGLNVEHLHHNRHNLQDIYQILKLLSLYGNMVIVRHLGMQDPELEGEHKCYADFFRVTEQQRKEFYHWLEKFSAQVHLVGNDRDVDYLILADLIEVDLIPLLDDVHPAEELL